MGEERSCCYSRFSKLEIFRGILNWAKENLTTEEVNKLLLAKDIEGRTVLHVSAKSGKLELFAGNTELG
jgi:hypothetical protein